MYHTGENIFVVINGLYTKVQQTERTHVVVYMILILVDFNPMSYYYRLW
jgi:hypothetical protein